MTTNFLNMVVSYLMAVVYDTVRVINNRGNEAVVASNEESIAALTIELTSTVHSVLDWLQQPIQVGWAQISTLDYLVDAAIYECGVGVSYTGYGMYSALDNALYASKMVTGEYQLPFEVYYDDLIDAYDFRFSRLFGESLNS